MRSKDSRFCGFVPALLVAGCLASPSAAATTGTSSFVVRLPIVSTNQLGPGDVAGRTNFRMALSNCTSVANGVRVFFEGGPMVDPASGTLTTSLPDVNLALFDKDGSQIAIGNESQRTDNALYQPFDTMDYQVAYQNVGAVSASAGVVTSSVVYSLHYP
jgi:major type 1 subunit fimbrin (pilin)